MFKKVLSTTLVMAALSATSVLTANAGVFDTVNNSLDKASASINKTSQQVKDAQAKHDKAVAAAKAKKEADKKAKEEAKKRLEAKKQAEKQKVKDNMNKKLDNLLNKI